MRKHYLDNLKTLVILLLFPIHTLMIWNNFGNKFYIFGGENNFLSSLIIIFNPWVMSLLFVIAGINAKHSLEKRGEKEFIKNRFTKLFIPFISGLLFLIPIQTLYARKFFFAYEGSLLENYKYFFTHITDLSGYDGAFTPGHLWFILFLFIISLLALVIMKNNSLKKFFLKIDKINIITIISLFIPVWLMYYIGNFGSFSLGKYFTLYLIGYYFFSNEELIDKIIAKRKLLLLLFILFQSILVITYYKFSYYGDLFVNFVGWLGVLASLIIGKLYLNKENTITKYFKESSYPIYLLHQTILVVIGYYTLRYFDNLVLQVSVIILGSFLTTIIVYELIKRIPFFKKTIGVK